MNTKRLFIAVDIDEPIRNVLRDEVYRSENLGRLSWVKPDNYHLTLKFLGDVAKSDIDKVAAIMERSAAGINRTTLTYTKLGVFPDLKRPRVIWAGFKESSDSLSRIAVALNDSLSGELNLKKEFRRFTPHLTIARVKDRLDKEKLTRFLNKGVNFKKDNFDVTSIVLYQSELQKNGAKYTKLKESALI